MSAAAESFSPLDAWFPHAQVVEWSFQDRIYQARHGLSQLFAGADMIESVRGDIEERLPRLHAHREAEHAACHAIEAAFAGAGASFLVRKLLEQHRRCRTRAVIADVDGATRYLWDHKCSHAKLCPDEANAETARLARRNLPLVRWWLSRGARFRVYSCVLTDHNSRPGQLLAGKHWFFERTQKWLKDCHHIKGALIVQEDPLAAGGDWNTHNNALVLTEGRFDYEYARKAWGANIQFRPVKGDDDAIAAGFAELIKYACQIVPTKSAEKRARHASKAPAFTDWPPERIVEWTIANGLTPMGRRFKRTRTYGVLFAPQASQWNGMTLAERVQVAETAGVHVRAAAWRYRELNARVGAGTLEAVRNALRPPEPCQASEALYLGSITWLGTRYSVDLIPGDNSPAEKGPPPPGAAAVDHWPTGPPLH